MSTPSPVRIAVPICPLHLEHPGMRRACAVCVADLFEQTLQQLADPMSTLTAKGVQQLAADALKRARGAT